MQDEVGQLDTSPCAEHPREESRSPSDTSLEDTDDREEEGGDAEEETITLEEPIPQEAATELTLERRLIDFFAERTQDGLYPVVAFGISPEEEPDKVGLLTAPIRELPEAVRIAEKVQKKRIHPGLAIPLKSVNYISNTNRIMECKERSFEGLNTSNPDHKTLIKRLMNQCSASRWMNRAFLLIDIVGFSQTSPTEQLSLRLSMGQTINQSIKRIYRLARDTELVTWKPFNRLSTGDGAYLWNYDASQEGHVATFLLGIMLMAQTEAMRKRDSAHLRLRAAFALGEAYTFPYHGPGFPFGNRLYDHFMPDAIGPVLNDLNRLITAASPGQIVVSPFDARGRSNRPGERFNTDTLLTRIASEILPGELSQPSDPVKPHDIVLRKEPNQLLRVAAKHDQVLHCFNICGVIPNMFRDDESKSLQPIGLVPDDAEDLEVKPFRDTWK